LDSYLYQTVGQDAIEFVAKALEVPLYRKIITGGAVEQGAEYGGRTAETSGGIEGDETEDLYTLLSTVKVSLIAVRSIVPPHLKHILQTHHPDVQGVSVGAILSNYQRVRVEHVYVLLLANNKSHSQAI
jgi:diphthine-ammonia ligase